MKLRRAAWLALVVPVAVMVAACSSSPSTPSSGSTAPASSSLKTGLKVFVVPKNLGNPYFTLAGRAPDAR
jgi:ABC-type sugar transport system substrate-binding protein